MKVLVDSVANLVRGTYKEPLTFSISGHYVIDIPAAISVEAFTPNPADLVAAKLAAFSAAHPLLPNFFVDEMLDVSQVDLSMSSRIVAGPLKRTAILPGGTLFTNPLTPAVGVGKVFLHYSSFSVYRDVGGPPTPGASRMLYNYDPSLANFVTSSTADLTVSVTNSLGAVSSTPPPDAEYVVGVPSPFRLSFTNTTSRVLHLSDWLFLYGT